MMNLKFKKYDELKDSGVSWLGIIPEHWSVRRLKDIGISIIGITYSPEDVLDEGLDGILVLRSSNIQSNKLCLLDTVRVGIKVSRKQTVRKGDILICSRNGSRALIGKNICIDERTEGQTFGAFMTIYRSKYFRFIQNFFNSNLFESQSGLYMSSTINQLTINTLNNFLITFPTLAEQKTISEYLDVKTAQIDRRIDLLGRKSTKYRQLKQSLINKTVTRGLDKTVVMKDSGVDWIDEVPEHWKVQRFKNFVDILSGYSPEEVNPELYGDIPYYKVDDLNSLAETGFIMRSTWYTNYTKCVYQNNLLLFPKRGMSILTNKVGITNTDCIFDTNLMGLKLSKKIVDIKFIFYWIINIGLSKLADITTIPQLNNKHIYPILIPMPNRAEQEAITEYLDIKTANIDRIVDTINIQIDKLKELRKILINDVVTGKIKVTSEGD